MYNKKIPLREALTRKKVYCSEDEPGKENLKRVLNLFDITLLAIGATLGSGVYVLPSVVSKTIAGPAVVLSFIIAAIVSSFSGLCYAEFASRVPKAGSSYIYSYVAVGEFTAFVIGWNVIIEHIIGVASVGKALSNYFDSLLGYPQKQFMIEHFPIHISFMGEYPDVASFLFIMIFTLLVAWGVRESSSANNIFTSLNLLTIFTIIISGCYFADFNNWKIKKNAIPAGVNGGNGGFFPFGWQGAVAGAAKCFYGFIGFETISTTGDETKNPKRTIPLALVISLLFTTTVYFAIAVVMTLMWPYYDHDSNAPLPVIYGHLGMPSIKYMVSGGAMLALTTTLIGCLFPLPRILYAMSSDGLLFKIFSKVNKTTKTPFISTIFCGTFAGTLSTVFNLEQLIDMTSIGVFQAYIIVCICVLVLRYKHSSQFKDDPEVSEVRGLRKCLNMSSLKVTSADTQYLSRVCILIYVLFAVVLCICLVNMEKDHGIMSFVLTVLCNISIIVLVIAMILLSRLPQANENISFKVPCVPLIPCLSIVLNMYLMMKLDIKTWIRFVLWICLGLLVYAFYGINHSLEALRKQEVKKNYVHT
ncbi:high affinity cationic amino acid transporter 1-like [Adelges cooleyi]|uniref:high affinity cationic amino acid transporter 1-like n=1 Tax=Adelges cooleyi TaxID=133065 RepID=UPI00217F6197|nr:high affinity cationic amino acid transporter 1-like [Adelges cooleyi]